MKPFKTFIVFIVALTGITGCTKDALMQSKGYPSIITVSVSDIDSLGATFEGSLLNHGEAEIIDFGFILNDGKMDYQFSIQKTSTLKEFKMRIETDLENGISYSCRTYAKTSKNLVLGNKLNFVGKGSLFPIIENFSPKAGFDGTQVTLKAKYLSHDPLKNTVFVNNVKALVVSSNIDSITFMVPSSSFVGNATISLNTGSHGTVSPTKFNIQGPVIESISATSGHSGDMFTLNGTNFLQNGNKMEVNFGGYTAGIVSQSNTQIIVIVPVLYNILISDQTLNINLINGSKNTTFKSPYTVLKSWQYKTPTPFNWTWKYQAVTYNNRGYILEMNTNLLYQYDPSSDQWNTYATTLFPGERNEGGLFIVSGDNLYKVGGYNYLSKLVYDVWVFNFISKTWTKKNNIPFNLYNGFSFQMNNQLYVVNDEGQLWKCNFENEQYTRMNDAPFNFKYSLGSTFTANNKTFAVVYGSTWQYDDLNDTWIAKAPNLFSKEQYSVDAFGFALNGTGYVLNRGTFLYKYDPINDRWVLTSNYPGLRSDNSYKIAFIIGSRAYVAATSGNYGGNSPLMYVYQE